MNHKLSLNCSDTEGQEGDGWWGQGGGGGVCRKGWGLKLFVMDRRAGECGKFQSRVDGMVGRRSEGGRSAGV